MHRVNICRRSRAAAPIFIIVLLVAASAGGETFPYDARIVVPGAPIRSGPGDAFYITDTLAEGQTVEVYRHRHNGWCAIRPPEESFSWIYSAHLQLRDDGLAEIDKDDVASRIGSRLSQQRNAVQVRLKKGEVVQVLGEATEAGRKWYKIAAPAGEFRWIHATCLRHADGSPIKITVDKEGPARAEQARAPAPFHGTSSRQMPATALSPIVTTSATSEPGNTVSAATQAGSAATTTSDWRAAPVAPPLAAIEPSSNTPAGSAPATTQIAENAVSQNTSPTVQSAPSDTQRTASAGSTPAAPPQSQSAAATGDLDRQLADVELRLSRMVATPPATWQVAPLQREAEELLTRAQTIHERSAVKVTLDKVDQFASIQRRYQQGAIAQPPAPATGTPSDITPLAPATAATAGASAGDAGRFDAVGVLRPVVSKRPGAPQFALVDPRGQVVSFVSPTPDMNLQPYVGRRVGVVGNRGFIPEFHRAHVTAGRITPLEERVVR